MTLPATYTPAPPAPPSRRPRWVVPLLVAVALALVGAGAVTAWALTRSPAQPATASAVPDRSGSPECVAVTRAHTAWDASNLPPDAEAFRTQSTELHLSQLMDDGKSYLGDVEGYADQPAKELASAVATYNAEVGMANVMLTLEGKIERQQAEKVMTALREVRIAYGAWRTATCL